MQQLMQQLVQQFQMGRFEHTGRAFAYTVLALLCLLIIGGVGYLWTVEPRE